MCGLRVQVLGLGRERQQGGDSKVRRPTLIHGGNTAVRPYCIVFVTVWIPKKYTVLEYRLSVFRPQIQGCITAVLLFLTLSAQIGFPSMDPRQGEFVVQQASTSSFAAEMQNKEDGQQAPAPQDVSPAGQELD